VWPAQRANYPGLTRTGWPPSSANRPDAPRLPAQTQVSRHTTAAVRMLVNGLTRQGTANDGTLSTVRDALLPFAVYSVPFRRHEMTRRRDNYRRSALFVKQTVCWPKCMRACVCAVNSVCASDQCTSETRDIVRHVGITIIVMSTNVRSISRYRLIDMNPSWHI